MDHSYRSGQANGNVADNGNRAGNANGNGFQQPNRFPVPDMTPVAAKPDAPARIFMFIDDLFFFAKIQEIAKKLNIKVEFVKTIDTVLERAGEDVPEDQRPSLVVIDLNNLAIKPLSLMPKLRAGLKKGTSIVGFVSHIQGDLKLKAQEAGFDVVMPRSAFSQNLPQLLRRHGCSEEDMYEPQP
jgi:PleD family two-component response regulator